MTNHENEKFWELVREGEAEQKHQARNELKHYYRDHYNILVNEIHDIDRKARVSSTVGRYTQPGKITHTESCRLGDINFNKRRELLAEYRDQVRSNGYEI